MDLWERHKELRENADRIGVNRYEALKKAESEVARLQQYIRNMQEIIDDDTKQKTELHNEVARLRGLLKDHATFLRQNGFDRQADDLMRHAPAPEETITLNNAQ